MNYNGMTTDQINEIIHLRDEVLAQFPKRRKTNGEPKKLTPKEKRDALKALSKIE